MTHPVEIRDLTKRFGRKTALESVSLTLPPRSLVGLVGRNGSGKTTLLRHIVGLFLPTSGECRTFGTQSRDLGPNELERIGFAQQRNSFLEWMRAGQLIRYASTFYSRWDLELDAGVLLGCFIVVQATFFISLRYYFARRDFP